MRLCLDGGGVPKESVSLGSTQRLGWFPTEAGFRRDHGVRLGYEGFSEGRF